MLKYNCIYLIENKRGENLKVALSVDMNTNKEKVIDFIGVIKDFFGSSYSGSDGEKSEKELLEWKKANKISDKNIKDFEEMLSHTDKVKKRKNTGKMNLANKSEANKITEKTHLPDTKVKKINNKEKEQGRGARGA